MDTKDVLARARQLVKKSGMSYEKIGVRMGYPKASARQSVGQFLKGTNPGIAMVLRFAEAIGVKPEKLFR